MKDQKFVRRTRTGYCNVGLILEEEEDPWTKRIAPRTVLSTHGTHVRFNCEEARIKSNRSRVLSSLSGNDAPTRTT